MGYSNYSKRPYEKKIFKKSSALIFGVGLGALLATVALALGLVVPILSPRLDSLVYRARTYYRKLMPHPEYLPTPAPTAVMAVAVTPTPVPLQPSSTLQPELGSAGEPQTNPLETQPGAQAPSGQEEASTPLPPTATLLPASTALAPVGPRVQLNGFQHQWQTWNNCGPATITTNMSYFGRPETQVEGAQFLKPNRDDKNVSPEELAAYARTTGLAAIVRRGGTVDLVKHLLSNNLPVLAETWLVHDGDGLGHYRLITGYDDAAGQFHTMDSLNGPEVKVGYEQFDADWRVFNRLYIVVHPPEQAEIVAAIIGPNLDDRVMDEQVLNEATAEVGANPNDAIAFFNQGDALTRLGRPQEAVAAFDRARQIGLHWRRLWYQFTPFEAYYAAGRYQDVLDLAYATIKGAGGLEEAYYYHGLALQATGQPGAEKDFQAALDYNPNFTPAHEILQAISTKSQ